MSLTYSQRAAQATHPLTKKLFSIVSSKKTNLALSADVTSSVELLKLADQLGPEICVLKTHIDIVEDFTPKLTQQLRQLADQHQFLIFEDRKFADIGNTVQLQYAKGIYRIVEWADIVNAHILPGPGIIEGLKAVGLAQQRGLLLLAEMSSKGQLASGDYVQHNVKLAQQHPDFVIGFIAQHRLCDDLNLVHMSPGVKLDGGGDNLGQSYRTPAQVIASGADIIIVGRDIYAASNPLQAAQQYRQAGWEALK